MRTCAPAAVLAAGLVAAAPAAAAAGGAEPLHPWSPHVREAAAYAAGRAGNVSFAVRSGPRLYGVRAWRTAPTASVLKVMLMAAYLRRVGGRPLRQADRRLLAPMIRWSDNVAATRVRDIVGNRGLWSVARAAGMRCFATHPIWGLSRTCAADQARFILHVDGYVPARHRRYALRLLGSIVRSQRWGIGRVRPRGWSLRFKGGWGSGSGAVDHQVALLCRGRRRLGLAILVTSSPSHAYGKRTLQGVARRLLRGLAPGSAPQ